MNSLILQCGGPTAVINASLAGILEGIRSRGSDSRIMAARLAFRGLANNDFAELTGLSDDELTRLRHQPGAALGSGRDLLDDAQIQVCLEHLRQHQITEVYLIGGNGTMAAAQKLLDAANTTIGTGALRVVGVPKTIDNDLANTDLCPGFASAARFIIHSVRDAALDLNSMRNFDDVVVFETMGRHTGWLAAASALARSSDDSPPHIMLIPEAPVDETALLSAIKTQHARSGTCFVVAAEGVRDLDGSYLAEKGQVAAGQDATGQKLLALGAGLASYLAGTVRQHLGLRCRIIRPDTIQRSTSIAASSLDRQLAYGAGKFATGPQLSSGDMVAIRLNQRQQFASVPLNTVIAHTRAMPAEFFLASQIGIHTTDSFKSYLTPLVLPLPAPAIIL